MKISTQRFSGEVPKISSRLLEDSQSQYAVNCDLLSGSLKPIKAKTQVYDVNESGKESIFRWKFNTEEATSHTVTNTTPSNWASVTDGSILLSTAGNSYEIIDIDFTGDTTMENIASTIQAKIRTATGNSDTCVWTTDHFAFNFDGQVFISMGAIYGTGTDITDTGYMNVRGDIVITQTDWVTADDFTYYFNSPIVDDQYQRLYSISSETGVYRVRSNDFQFTDTDREMVLDIPPAALTAVAPDPILYNSQDESPAVPDIIYFSAVSFDIGSGSPTTAVRFFVAPTLLGFSSGDEFEYRGGSVSFTATLASTYSSTSTTVDWRVNVIEGTFDSGNGSASFSRIGVEAGTYYPALEGSPRAGDIYDRSYVWTYTYENGEESPISLVSDEVKIYPEGQSDLTVIGTVTPPTGVTFKNIYTTDVDRFRFLAQIDGTDTVFTDNLSAVALGEELQVFQNAPSNMDGIVVSSQGFCIGWRGNDVFFSESFLPYAWDDRWSLNFANDVVACVAVSGEIYVLTTGAPYLLTGYHPSELISSQLPINQSCANKKAVTNIGNQVIYASPDGLISLSGSKVKLITADFYTRIGWQELNPTTMRLANHDDEIYIFTDTETYILSTRSVNNGIVRMDEIVDSVYEDIEEDILYTYNSTSQFITSLRTSASDATYTWRSKEHDFKRRTHLSCAKVIADSYDDLTLKLYTNGDYTSPASTKVVISNRAFRLPDAGSYSICAYELVGTDEVHSIQIGTNMKELEG